MDQCVFCMIVSGEIPAKVVYQDDDILAFDDITPQGPVHTLLIPKHHYDGLSDDVPEELLGKIFAAVDKVAAMKGVRESGYRVVVNNGKHASQTVKHLHVHVIGGKQMSHGMVRFDDGE